MSSITNEGTVWYFKINGRPNHRDLKRDILSLVFCCLRETDEATELKLSEL